MASWKYVWLTAPPVSMLAVHGLFVATKLLENTLQVGAEAIADVLLKPEHGKEVDVVPAQIRNNKGDLLMTRVQRSIGCMVVTGTGIFFVQGGNLQIYKASPWQGVDSLDAYQAMKAKLYPQAYKMYTQSLGTSFTDAMKMWQFNICHWLLHMILRDMRELARTPNKEIGQVCLSLLEIIKQKKTDRKSFIILAEWCKDHVNAFKKCVQDSSNPSLFYKKAISFNDEKKCKEIMGINVWEPSVAGDVFMHFKVFAVEYEVKEMMSPILEREATWEWLRVGRIHYTFL